MNSITSFVISDVPIRQDAEGRFCLNDLHKSSGGETKHQPAFFMRRAETKDLIAEIQNSADLQSLAVSVLEGRKGGTFVVRELVYAYAMWISPAFHVKVIRAYDAMISQRSKRSALVDLPLPPELLTAIDQRAWELSRNVYEHFRTEMLNYPNIREGRVMPAAWEPRCVQHAPLKAIESAAKMLEYMAFGLRSEGRKLAGLFGFDYEQVVNSHPPEKV